jgi:hypothetical protein
MDENIDKPSRFEKFRKPAIYAATFAAGSVTTLVYLRCQKGMGLSESIVAFNIDDIRRMVEPGSPHILTLPDGTEKFVTKVRYAGRRLKVL